MLTPEQAAAYVNGQAAILIAKVAGMHAENMRRISGGHAIAYTEEHFQSAIDESGCHHNAAQGLFNEANSFWSGG